MKTYEQHPLSGKFPTITDEELSKLSMDIKENGQRQPGVLLDGMVLDGWHRYLVCYFLGVKFKAKELEKGVDPIKFVLSQNLHRRHLSASQRALIATESCEWKKVGRPNRAPVPDLSATNEEISKLADTSPRTVKQAKVAIEAGLGDAVRNGEISAKAAAESAKPKPPKPKPNPDNKFQARILELEAELESANERIATLDEMLADYDTIKTEHEYMSQILDEPANERLNHAISTIKQQAALIQKLEERIRGLQGERNMAIKAAKRVRK